MSITPNAYVTIHADGACPFGRRRGKEGQRTTRLDVASLSAELGKCRDRAYRFASEAELNDMWLEVDFGDEKFERAVIDYVKSLLARHYRPFGGVEVTRHCQAAVAGSNTPHADARPGSDGQRILGTTGEE